MGRGPGLALCPFLPPACPSQSHLLGCAGSGIKSLIAPVLCGAGTPENPKAETSAVTGTYTAPQGSEKGPKMVWGGARSLEGSQKASGVVWIQSLKKR